MNKKKGFTLIELMVVIAIIGILATIITASLSTAKAKGRDAKRISDIKTIQTALALYYNDNQFYPINIYSTYDSSNGVSPADGLSPTYLPVVPTDPSYGSLACASNPSTTGCYRYTSYDDLGPACTDTDVAWYHLGAILEDPSSNALTQDADASSAVTGYNACTNSTPAFRGQTKACAGAELSQTLPPTKNDPAVTTETCYDWTP
jgi:type II secretion system protein G